MGEVYVRGWAMQHDETERCHAFRKRYAEIMESGAVFDLKMTPAYGHTKFRGTVEANGVELSEEDVAIVADAGNLCFGGACRITRPSGYPGRLSVSGRVNTD